MDTQVQTILNLKVPGYTELRKFSKESLIQSIIEMKKDYSSETVRLKELELEIQKMNYNLEMKKMEAEVSKHILQYSSYEDNRYGPMAAANVSAAVSNIMGAPMEVSSEVKEATDLETRVDVALKQGLKWNSNNKRPELNSTVLRKVEIWEKALEAGREADPEDYCSMPYSKIISSTEGSEAFILGLCETMEEKLNIKASSKYLKTRFKRNVDKLHGQPVSDNPPPSYADQASGLAERFWGDNISPDQMEVIKKKLTGRIEKAEGVQNLTVRGLKGLCDVDHLPIAINFSESQREYERNRALCWSEVHDDEVGAVIDDYAKELGLE